MYCTNYIGVCAKDITVLITAQSDDIKLDSAFCGLYPVTYGADRRSLSIKYANLFTGTYVVSLFSARCDDGCQLAVLKHILLLPLCR